MKKINKGFTLVELLAVIVIITLIALVTVPIIVGVIDSTRKGALEDSAYGLIDAAGYYYATTVSGNLTSDLTFNCTGDTCITSDNEELSFKGEITYGQVILNKTGSIEICISDGINAATNIVDGESSSKVYSEVGSCDGVNLQSSSTEVKETLLDVLKTIDASTKLTSSSSIADLQSAIETTLSVTNADPANIVSDYVAWSNGDKQTGEFVPTLAAALTGVYGGVTTTASLSIPYTVTVGDGYILSIAGAYAGVSSGYSMISLTTTGMDCTAITTGQYGSSTYTYVQLFQYYCVPTATSVTGLIKTSAVSNKWTFYSSLVKVDAN